MRRDRLFCTATESSLGLVVMLVVGM